jgi:hypothetical protein
MHLTRNQAYLHGYRGFKSLSLRQFGRKPGSFAEWPRGHGALLKPAARRERAKQQLPAGTVRLDLPGGSR